MKKRYCKTYIERGLCSIMDNMKKLQKAQAAHAEMMTKLGEIQVEYPVRTTKDAQSEKTLLYCIERLKAGDTYNELRRRLGLGNAAVDHRWRIIRELLVSHILPDTDEEMLLQTFSMSSLMVKKLESFTEKVQERARQMKGGENEHHFLRAELEAIKILSEKYESRMDHYLRMKNIKAKEKRGYGKSIVFQNNYYVPRPGDEVEVKDVIDVVKDTLDK